MQEILFITSNKGKVASLRNRLLNTDFNIVQKSLELPEIQADSVREVCEAKAKLAFSVVNQPLIVQDSGLNIFALKGFPGPYLKYVQSTIGAIGIVKLLNDVEDRSCRFESALTYIDNAGKTFTFTHESSIAQVAKEVDSSESSKAWGEIWKIYIPKWSDKPLSAIAKEEIDARESKKDDNSEFAQFTAWLNASSSR